MNWLCGNKAVQRLFLIGAVVVGGTGLLGGAWLAINHDPSSVAGLIGGVITLAIGWVGLRTMRVT